MKRPVYLILCLCLLSIPCFGKTNTQRRRARAAAPTVTVTGCIREGVECLVLEPLGRGRKYSVTRSGRLSIGRAYRITGRISQVGFCMQGMPILNPTTITPLRMRCPPAKGPNNNSQ